MARVGELIGTFRVFRLRAPPAMAVDGGGASGVPMARRMAPVVAVVIALHAALLAMPVRSARHQGAGQVAAAVQVRLLATSAMDERRGLPLEAASTRESAPPTLLQLQATRVDPAPTEVIRTAVVPIAESTSVTPPLPAIGLVLPGADRDDDYYPRSMLSLAPSPIDTIVIDYPLIGFDGGRHVGEATLFIDESGRVVRVRFEGAPLPAPLEEAARSAFTNARFRAGEAAGRNVKAQIRVEVAFDGASADLPPGQRS